MKLKSYLLSLLVLFACSLVVTSCEEDPIDKFGDVTVDGHTLAIELRVGGQTSNAVNVEVLPSNNESTYYYGIIPAEEVGEATGEKLVQMLLKKNENSQLLSGRTYVTAEEMATEAPLQPATAYLVYALGYDAGTKTETSDLAVKHFKTKKGGGGSTVSAPEVEFIGITDEKEGIYGFAARCSSKDATEAYIGVLPVGAYDQLKGEGVTLETFFDNIEGYMIFSQQNGWLDMLNTEDGIALNAGNIDGKGREGILKVFNADNAVTVAWTNTNGDQDSWSSASTNPTPDDGITAPEVLFQGSIDEAEGLYVFAAKCVSGDATGAMIGLLEGGAYDTLKGQGGSLANVFDMLEGATDFASQQGWIEALNSENGLGLNAGKVEGSLVLEAFLKVTNDEGGITVKWADTKGQGDSWDNSGKGGDTPAGNGPMVDFVAGVREGVVTFAMICTSQDATAAYMLIADKAQVDTIDAPLEQIMDENLKQAIEFTSEWMTAFNSADGLSLTNAKLDVNTVWTGILDTRNDGGRLVKRADTDSGEMQATRVLVRSAKVAFKPAYVSGAVALR